MPSPPVQRRAARIAAVLAVLVGMATAHQLGVLDRFADPAAVKRTLVELGPWGYAAFVGAYAALQPFGFPAMVFYVSAPLIWPWPIAFALSISGATAASVVGFVFARFVAREWVRARVPARLRRHDDALARHAFKTVFVLRSLLWMSSPLHAFFGVSQVGFWTHLWGSLAAYVLPLLLLNILGERLFELVRAAPPALWIGLGIAAAAALGLWLWARRRRRAAPMVAPALDRHEDGPG